MSPTTRKAFAAALGVSYGRLGVLIARGLPLRFDGKIDRPEALVWLLQHGSERIRARAVEIATELVAD